MSSSINENSHNFNTHKSRWIRRVLNDGNKPIIGIIHECISLDESNEMERYYIEKYNNDGYRLTNSYVSDVTEFSKETREKMSSAKKGKKLEEIYGIEKAKELKKKFAERTIDFSRMPKPENVKNKISETLKEYFSNPENHWAYGKKMSDDYNEKLRLAKLNNPKNIGNRKPRTDEQKEELRKKILGRKVERHKILQCDMNNILIKEWKSLRDIEKEDPTLKRNQISKCCKGEKDLYAGYIWKYKIE